MTKSVHYFNREQLVPHVKSKLDQVDVLLDIGCGIRPQDFTVPKLHICCEPYKEYLDVLDKNIQGEQDRQYLMLNATWLDAVRFFPEKSVDTVFLVDVIEHLDKQEGIELLKQTENIARKQIVIFTPLGFMPQCHPNGVDAWGLNGGSWQEHKSGWLPEDFDDSWDAYVAEKFHFADHNGMAFDVPYGAFWAIKSYGQELKEEDEQLVENRKDKGWKQEKPIGGITPVFSVLVPTYNHAKFLSVALDSLLGQTFANWEAVVVNDGSTDATEQILEAYSKRDSRIKVIHQINGGTAAALNTALENAQGEWFCWLSSDDWFLPDKLETYLTAMQEVKEARFFYTDHAVFYENSQTQEDIPSLSLDLKFQTIQLLQCNNIAGNSVCFHRSVFEELGFFNQEYPCGQDFDYWLRASCLYPFFHISKVTCVTRIHRGMTSQILPMAGRYDSARSCLGLLNYVRFEDLIHYIDYENVDELLGVVERVMDVALNEEAFMYQGLGYLPALMDRLIEWLVNMGFDQATMNVLWGSVIQFFEQNAVQNPLYCILVERFTSIMQVNNGQGYKYQEYSALQSIKKNLEANQILNDDQRFQLQTYYKKSVEFQRK